MKQERLNNLMIHKEHIDLKQVADDFVSGDQHSHKMGGCGWVGVALAKGAAPN